VSLAVRVIQARAPPAGLARSGDKGLTKAAKSTKIVRMNCLDIRIALIISTIHRMVG
jgi:hypothetical protein